MRSFLFRIAGLFAIAVLFSITGCKRLPPDSWMDERDGSVYTYCTAGNLNWTTCNLNYIDKSIYCKGAWVFSYDEKEYEDALLKTKKSDSGVLYDWEMAKKACPEGWRLPTVKEWQALLNPSQSSNRLALGDFNFILDGRARSYEKFCIYSGITLWTSDISDSGDAAIVVIINFADDGSLKIRFEEQKKSHAFYVRCVRDKNYTHS